MGILHRIAIALVFCWPAVASARPVSYADGWMAMSMNGHDEYSQMLSYSPTAHYALGVRTDYIRDEESWMHSVTYNRLLKRWNEADAQANLFLMTGAGGVDAAHKAAPAAFAGIEADWENRRYYVLYENRYVASSAIDQEFSHKARVGIAPYIAEYDSIHTWLMLQVDHHPEARDPLVVTPMVRVFNTTMMGEFGISHKKDVMVNFIYQF